MKLRALIAGILGDKLASLVDEALSSGREPLVEVHDEKETGDYAFYQCLYYRN